MKRLRFGGEAEMESVSMANVLMLLSRGQETGRVFECKTCNRKFPSFQALGGHRASHKKPRVIEGGDGQGQGAGAGGKTRVHECSVCGLEFAIGQALGGHMRRHRAAATEKKSGGKRVLWLDLNLPASESEEDMECPEIGLGLGLGLALVDKTSMVDCFH